MCGGGGLDPLSSPLDPDMNLVIFIIFGSFQRLMLFMLEGRKFSTLHQAPVQYLSQIEPSKS